MLGHLAPGDRLQTEDQLTAQLGVSRTTLREAVSVLARSGVLDVRQGDGTYVRARPTPGEPLDVRLRRAAALEVYEVRRMLEIETARLAAARRTADDLEALHTHRGARSGSRAPRRRRPRRGRRRLPPRHRRRQPDAVLADLFRSFATRLRDTITDVIQDPTLPEDTAPLHRALLDAIARQDATAAVDATRLLLDADARLLRN